MAKEKDRTLMVVSVLLIFASLSYLPFVYEGTFGEPDSFRMANGIIHSIITDQLYESPLLFRLDYSFGYYTLLYLFTPIFKTNLALVITFMNYINAISAIVMVIPFFLVVKRYWGTTAGVVANILLIFVPSWWNLSLYGHPMLSAMLLVFVGLALIGYRSQLALSGVSPWKLIGLDVLIVATFALCLTFRLDAVLLLFPLIPACLFLERYAIKKVIFYSILLCGLPVVIFFVLQSIFVNIETVSTPESLVQLILKWHSPTKLIPSVTSLAVSSLANHPLYLLAFAISCVYLAYRRNYLTLGFIGPAFSLNFLFWLTDPAPMRHFVYIAPVLAVGIAIGLSAIPWQAKLIAKYNKILAPIPIALLFVVASLISMELIYLTIRAYYPWENGIRDFSDSYPIRSLFINKYYTEVHFYQAAHFAEDLQQLEPKDKPILVIAHALPVVLQLQLSSETVKNLQSTGITLDNSSDLVRIYLLENEKNRFIIPSLKADLKKNPAGLFEEFGESYLAKDSYFTKYTAIASQD